MSLVDQECFAQALLNPTEPTPALKRAITIRFIALPDSPFTLFLPLMTVNKKRKK
ncbi:hypothetical protein [Photorhabdus sp. RM322S]|uniref:hypothetical protein n=1 Tax=Photorhabdus TaxID=29487 RepID=UPI0036DF6A04